MKNEEFDIRFAQALEQSLPPFSPQVKARAVEGMAAVATRASRKETRPMRRLAYVMAFLLVIALVAAGAFTRSRPPNGKALLISAAQAMESARSVRLVGHGCIGDKTSPSGMKMMPEQWDSTWSFSASERRMERRIEWRKGGPQRNSTGGRPVHRTWGIDLDENKLWSYDSRTGICYTADITAVASLAAVVVRSAAKREEKKLPAMPIPDLDWLVDRHESVRMETRGGREIAVITYTGTNTLTSPPLAERHVFEVDTATNHLLGRKRYVRAEGSEEQLIETIDLVEYDVPVPGIPKGAKVVTATARVEETDKDRSLVMYAPDGEGIWRSDQPK
jgi:hypothetical protein